ncbi:helix-turn-helix domain-containing protein [Bacteroides caccae]|jgi:ligand-binding sensor domain-containing protein/AraC-like DNA-binding protein|uniref:Helix-turn-helix domain-containing protein n=1 Tax=Bacteroides caccae TaxID=47678 RepID=A0A6L3KMW2_9BACE|nr:AraC family transcriptional regulator [Bacteroides caccae]KAA5441437.1 helix-turn-helix domain-containing protein [Bacteroides caccae]KAA5459424.1 helix-turn-helix domain-containing protein [Bacteroides caccae]MDU3579929.1 two-component regulator propeller domain-containing protein [Bacteroides caccae]MDU3629012.1 two-component regulator propeller domain-containing protein [Bacteroides caccae]MDU3671886.1 two-component regulator propeller domain-containing protein [Bacteroides caccae]
MYRTLIIILFLLAGVKLLSSEHCVNYSFTQLSIEQGLSQSTAQSILLDHKGTLWIGTKSGLNSYTQEGIKTYLHHSGDPHSLPSNYINHLTEDSLGNFWIATSKGLALYDDEQDQFNTVNSSIIYSSVGVEGGMWFGSENAIHCYDYKSKELKTIHIEKEEGKGINLVDYRIQKMLYLEDGKILIGTRKKGIYLYDCRIRQFTLLIPSSQNLLTSLYVTADHHIYTAFYGDGFYCYDRTGKMLKHYTKENSGLKNNYVLDMAEYNGNIWLATDGSGINLFTPRTFQFSQLQHIVGDYSSLPVNSITLLYKDMKDNLWAGSVRGGIFSIKETYIKTYKEAILNNTNGLSEQSVISLYEEKDGKVWIGTDGGGINLYDPSTDKFIHFPSTYGDKVVSIAEVSETELMVSLYTKGIFLFNKKTHKYRPFTIVDEETNKKECFYGYLPLANQVADGKIYIISCGTYVYHTHDHTFSRMQTDRDYDFSNDALCLSYSNDRFSLLKCAHQAFWVDQKSDSIRLLFELEKDELITSMSYDNNRMIWTSTNKGLGFFDLESQKYHRIRTRLFNGISYLIADGKGRLWICAQNHLYSYIIKENRFILWNSSDGFPPNEILFAYQKQSNRDYIYLGGSEGLVKINTDIPYTETQIPEIYLSEILFNGSPSLKKVKENTIKIPWNYNSLSVHFRIKNRDVFQKYLLQYTIEGRGKQSIETYDPVLNLSSLSAGNYSIWVSCNTKNGNRTPSKQLIHIIVTPPWYKTVWFIGVAAVLFIIMTASIGYIHYRRKERNMKGNVNYFLQAVLNDMLSSKEEKQRGEEDNFAETPLSDISSKEDDSRLEETGQQTQAKNSKEDEEFLNKLNMLIHENMAGGELSIKFLTDKLAMSRASLYNKVKFLTGLGVNDYINRLRIEKSVFLLTNTNMNINEISYEVGFSYPRYFSTSFKQIKGMTPTRFKEENKKN